MAKYGRINYLSERVIGTSSEGICLTYRGYATHPYSGELLDVYFKIFDPRIEPKGKFNELFGYYAGRHYKLPTAETFLCACKGIHLKGPFPEWIHDFDKNEYYSGIASVNVKPTDIRQLRSSPELFVEDVLRWKNLPYVVAFDEATMNSDRTIQNLIRLKRSEYAMIDHEKLFDSPSWQVDELELLKGEIVGNGLATLVIESSDDLLKLRCKRIASEFKILDELSEKSFPDDLDVLCNLPAGSTKYLVHLVNDRIKILPQLLNKHEIISGQIFAE